MTKIFQQKLNKIIERLKPYNPQKIILYGSHARGDARKDSDIDLLIIKRTKKDYFKRMPEVYDLLYKEEYFLNPNEYIKGLDFGVYTPQEIQQALNKGSFFFQDVLEEGKIIYEQKRAKSTRMV